MKNLSFLSTARRTKYQLPAAIAEIADGNNKRQLPRHISGREIESSRGKASFNRLDHIPKMCQIKLAAEEKTNIAFDILKYQLSDRQTQEKHLENARSNLQRRLQVAKNRGDRWLVDILVAEYQQLETSV